MYIPRKHKLTSAFDVHKKKTPNSQCRLLSLFLSLQFFCSGLTDCQAQRKVLTFSQATLPHQAFSMLPHTFPPLSPSMLSSLPGQKSASPPFTELLFLQNSVTPNSFFCFVLHLASPSRLLLLFHFGASMQLHSSSSFAPPSFLYTFSHKTSHAQPCSHHGENIRRQNQDG